jgi:hypothetical protein
VQGLERVQALALERELVQGLAQAPVLVLEQAQAPVLGQVPRSQQQPIH